MTALGRLAERYRLGRIIVVVAVSMSAYHLTAGYVGEPVAEVHRPLHLLLALIILFWTNRDRGQGWRFYLSVAWDLFLTATTLAATLYLFINAEEVQSRMIYVDLLSRTEIVLGCGLILVILEAARRSVGWVLVGLVLLFLLYGYFGNHLPAPFWHRGYSFNDILETAYLTQDGIWTTPLAVTASFIFLFVLFGSVLLASGAGTFFTDFANALTGRTIGGPAKTAVVSSALMGMLSGSSPANVVTTGSFTIPTMKKAGYPPAFAAGVEAVASAGGQFAPPIMGAAAFIMMDFVGVSYLTIMQISIIPALLYFIAVFIMVDLEARRLNLRPAADHEVGRVWPILRRRGYLFLPIVVMIWVLIEGYTPTKSALYAIFMLVVLILFDKENRKRILAICFEAMDHAPRIIGPVTVACAVGGIIVGMITLTGLGLRMSSIVLAIAGSNMVLLLVMTMVVGIVLGMGMPTSGAYIILAALLAPGLLDFGVPILAAHMFVIYCAGTSSITPPVAIASYAAAAVAGTDPWKTSLIAFRLGLASFIIPYMFVFDPALLGLGTPLEVAHVFLTACVGIFALAVGVIGWLGVVIGPLERLAFLFTALMLVQPGWITDGTGLILFIGLVGFAYVRSRRL